MSGRRVLLRRRRILETHECTLGTGIVAAGIKEGENTYLTVSYFLFYYKTNITGLLVFTVM